MAMFTNMLSGRTTQDAGETDANAFSVEGESLDPIFTQGTSITGAMATIGQQTLMPHDENFKKSKKLGQGGFGTVWLCERSKSKVRSKLLGECERRCRSAALSMEVNLRPYSSNCIYSFASECECGYLRGKYVVHGCWETPSRLEHTPFKPPHEPTA